MPVSIRSHSRLQFAELFIGEGVEYWDTLDLPDIPIQTDDLQHTVSGPDRLDTIAYKFYGDPMLWWVIAAVNDLERVPTDLNTGQVLRIPSPGYVLEHLFQRSNNSNQG